MKRWTRASRLCSLFLLTALPGLGQGIPAVGSDSTFDVGTWNLYWFGHPSNGPVDDARQFERVAATMRDADLDLWAVQEVADPTDFERLLVELGDRYEGTLAEISGEQRIGFVYRTDVVSPAGSGGIRHILANQSAEFAGRPPLLMEATVALPDSTFGITLIVVHLKASDDAESYDRRVASARALKNYLDFLLPRKAVIILGDFNDLTSGSIVAGRVSPFQNFVLDAQDYRFVSRDVEFAGQATWCGNVSCTSGSAIDHILLTNEVFSLFVNGSCKRMASLLDVFPGYATTTSDHLPVTASFVPQSLSTPIASDRMPAPAGIGIHLYPNPFRDEIVLETNGRGFPLEISVVDGLGRTLFRTPWPGAAPSLRLRAADWAAGPLWILARSATGVRAHPAFKAP